ncbi:ABC transporter permease [Halomonas sp. ISL-60]|nr:ABC transporter permease [Halomonas sp. ISL-60]MBT2800820.1 ABC transporter permease [Halomonas sp. ISL-56]
MTDTHTPGSAMHPAATAPLAVLSPGQVALRRALKHTGFWAGGGILLLIVLAALLAPLIAPYDPAVQSLGARFVPPMWAEGGSTAHLLGTDNLGRDVFSRLLFGARTSVMLGFLTVLVSGFIGVSLGLAAGYFGGWVDLTVNFLINIRLTLPVVLVALVVVAVMGNSLTLLVMVIGLLLWDRFAIVTRSATQALVGREFVTSARTIGSSTLRIILREILPNITGPLIVVASIELAHAILLEASLSFLGLGVQPPLVSWGLMIAEAKSQLLFRPWMIAIPGVALVCLILAINLLGDALRDITTPEGKA